jgi:hypothetical protein
VISYAVVRLGAPIGVLRVECSLPADSVTTVILSHTHSATLHKTHYKPIGSPRRLEEEHREIVGRDFAVFRLMTSSNFIGCSTGDRPLAPFRILLRGGGAQPGREYSVHRTWGRRQPHTPLSVYCWQSALGHKVYDVSAVIVGDRGWQHDERIGTLRMAAANAGSNSSRTLHL